MAVALPSFIFGPGQDSVSAEELRRKRMLIDALRARNSGVSPGNMGEGIGQLLGAIALRMKDGKLRKEEGAAQAGAADLWKGLLQPSAPMPTNGATAATPPSPETLTGSASTDVLKGGTAPANWLKYANQGATRNQPLNPALVKALGFLPEMGVSMKVFSGGQDATGPRRTGSHRHDHGNSGDVFFEKDGRQLDWSKPEDAAIFQDIVRKARANGVTGFGAGEGYMQPGSMHLGFGSPAVWGAGGRGANAPGWLREAFNGGQAQAPNIVPASAPPPGQTLPQNNEGLSMSPMPAGGPPPQVSTAPQQRPMTAFQRMTMTALNKGSQQEPRPGMMAQQMGMSPGMSPSLPPMSPGGPQMAAGGQGMSQPQMAPAMAQPGPAASSAMPAAPGNRLQSLAAAIGDPRFQHLEPIQQKFILEEYQREAERANPDPMAAVDLQLKQAQLDKLRNPQADPVKGVEVDGNLVDPTTGKVIYQGQPKPGYRFLTPAEKQQMGLPPHAPIQVSPEGKIEVIDDLTPKPDKPPGAVQEYEYAKGQGFKGTFQEWEAQKKGPGLSVQLPDGTVIQQGGKAFTEGQSKDVVFSTRAEGALQKLEPIADSLAEFWSANAGGMPVVGNYLKSDDYQAAEQAAKDFLAPILRKDTGAAVTDGELITYGATFLPQPGDNPTTLAQKKASRRRAVEAIKAGMPAAAILAQAQALAKGGPAPMPDAPLPEAPLPETTAADPDNPKPGDIVDGFKFKGGDPAKQENWEMVQ